MNNQYVYKENGFEIVRRDLSNRNNSDEENLVNFVNAISNKKQLNRETIIKMLFETTKNANIEFINIFSKTNKEFIDNTIETNQKILKIFRKK